MPRRNISYVFVLLSAIALLTTSVGIARDDSVRVSARVNTSYDDSARSRQEIAQFIDFFPPEKDLLHPGDTVNLFIIRRYRFGSSDLPKTYSILQTHICRLNHIATPYSRILTRQILAPPLPRRAHPKPNWANPYNALPKIATFRAFGFAGKLSLSQVRPTEASFREGSRTTVVNAEMPRSAVEAKRSSALFASDTLRVSSSAVRLGMHPAGCGVTVPTGQFPDDQVRNAVLSTLKRPILRHAYLFILDSGWPDESSYTSSVARIEATLTGLRAKYHLKPYVRRQPPKFVPLDPTKSSTHVLGVASAIAPFRTLDSDPRVRIIFVPLSLDQGDDDLYRNLFETYYAFTWGTSLNATTPAGAKLTEPVLQQEAEASADAVIKSMKTFAPPGEFYTDNSVLDAVYMLGDTIATSEQTSYIVNESWSVDSGLLKFSAPPALHGITVTAAGNDGQDFVAKGVDFASQAAASDHYLAVMNVSSQGDPQCRSAVFDPTRLDDVRAVGFDGNLTSDSGTSYSAPRVAWLVALRETTTAPPASAFWAVDIAKKIKSVRESTQKPWKNVVFDVQKYLTQ